MIYNPHMRVLLCLLALSVSALAQSLSTQWEELTAGDFVQALQRAQNVCVLPFGVIEKHGPHLPLGNDLINVRYVSLHGAAEEYAIVFPPYFFGQIFEAKHQPGTIAYSARLQLELLQETTDEMGRNGCKKILIVNGHGGNNNLLPFFAQSQLQSAKDYVVYVYARAIYPSERPPLVSETDSHAGESETSHTLISRPDLVHMDRASSESGTDQSRLDLPQGVYTGIWWYARYPNHYAGDGSLANTELGDFDMKAWSAAIANAIRAIKSDQVGPRLQQEFFEGSQRPMETQQGQSR